MVAVDQVPTPRAIVEWLWAGAYRDEAFSMNPSTPILDDQSLSNISVLIPIGLLVTMFFSYSRPEASWHPLCGTMIKVGAWAMAIIALYALIDDTLITSGRYSGATLFYELVFYAAGILFGVGAWQMRGDTR